MTAFYYLRLFYDEPRQKRPGDAVPREGTILVEVGADGLMEREIVFEPSGAIISHGQIRGMTDSIRFNVHDLETGIAPDGCELIDRTEFERLWETAEGP